MFHKLLSQSCFWCSSFLTSWLFFCLQAPIVQMETSTKCYVCHADKTKASNRHLSFFQYLHTYPFLFLLFYLFCKPNFVSLFPKFTHTRFPSGLDYLPDQVWRIKWLTALKFSQEIIDKPPSQIERGYIICERHFTDASITNGKRLVHGSVPDLFLDEIGNNEVQVYLSFCFKK